MFNLKDLVYYDFIGNFEVFTDQSYTNSRSFLEVSKECFMLYLKVYFHIVHSEKE